MKKVKGKSKKAKVKNRLTTFGFYFLFFIPPCLCFADVSFYSTNRAQAQTGGGYDLSHNVIASGGGSQSSGGSFTLSGTVGQPLAGTFSFGGTFNLRAGFWAFASNTPTAATLSIQGEVTSLSGKRISGMTIILLDTFTNRTRTTITDEKGRYSFEELEINHFYIVRVAENKQFAFTPESQMFELTSSLTDINFTAMEIENQ